MRYKTREGTPPNSVRIYSHNSCWSQQLNVNENKQDDEDEQLNDTQGSCLCFICTYIHSKNYKFPYIILIGDNNKPLKRLKIKRNKRIYFEISNKTEIMKKFDELLHEVDEIPINYHKNKLSWMAEFCLGIDITGDDDEPILLLKMHRILEQLKKKGSNDALYVVREITERIEDMINPTRINYKKLFDSIKIVQKFGPPLVRDMIVKNEYHYYVDNEQKLLNNLESILNFCNNQMNKNVQESNSESWTMKDAIRTIELQRKYYLKQNLRIWIKESKILDIL